MPGGYAGGNEVNSFILAADEVTNDKAEATGVHVRNVGEVEDVNRWCVVWRIGLEDIA